MSHKGTEHPPCDSPTREAFHIGRGRHQPDDLYEVALLTWNRHCCEEAVTLPRWWNELREIDMALFHTDEPEVIKPLKLARRTVCRDIETTLEVITILRLQYIAAVNAAWNVYYQWSHMRCMSKVKVPQQETKKPSKNSFKATSRSTSATPSKRGYRSPMSETPPLASPADSFRDV